MNEYHKIQSVFLRDPATNYKRMLFGEWAMPEFKYLQDNEWTFTEKVDGTNIRVMWDGQAVTFGGKTNNASIPAFLVNRLQERFNADMLRAQFGDTAACLYGEGYGAKIQKGGGNYRADQDFVLFDIKIGEWWLQRPDLESIAVSLGIDIVPVIGVGTLHDMVRLVSTGFDSRWGAFAAEGIVARPRMELKARSGQRIITKLKHVDFT